MSKKRVRGKNLDGWIFEEKIPEKSRKIESVMAGSWRSLSAIAACHLLLDIENNWGSIVGRTLCGKSSPHSFENGILNVHVSSAGVMHEMNFRKKNLMDKINSLCPGFIKTLNISVGRLNHGRRINNGPDNLRKRKIFRHDPAREEKLCASLREKIKDEVLLRSFVRFRMAYDRDWE